MPADCPYYKHALKTKMEMLDDFRQILIGACKNFKGENLEELHLSIQECLINVLLEYEKTKRKMEALK